MRYAAILLLLFGCSESGPEYSVRVTNITKAASATYCTYWIEPANGGPVPKNHFLADCGKYNVGDIVTVEFGN